MVEAADAKELIDEAIERAETERSGVDDVDRKRERTFRDRVSVLVGVLAVSLAIVHMAAAGKARESLLRGIEASDTFNYMQAKIIRETVVKTAAAGSTTTGTERAALTAEAARLRSPSASGHGIGQLEVTGKTQREAGEKAAAAGEGYEVGETALQLAIVLLSIALVARSWAIVGGATIFAIAGLACAVATAAGIALPWIG